MKRMKDKKPEMSREATFAYNTQYFIGQACIFTVQNY